MPFPLAQRWSQLFKLVASRVRMAEVITSGGQRPLMVVRVGPMAFCLVSPSTQAARLLALLLLPLSTTPGTKFGSLLPWPIIPSLQVGVLLRLSAVRPMVG